MKYGSVCSGIEAASVAWHDLGWEPQWFSEIEQFPSEVLKHRFPDVPNLGDMTQLTQNSTFNEQSIDLLVGGTPCQSFSVAGLRKGLADPRGNLMLTFLALADAKKPKWIVWENVPGVLSSNGGKDFGTFLGALGELGYGFAYRVLDAQYFGVAQRRRRVFVVGYLGDWRVAAAVLFERESLQGNIKPSRKKREEVTADAEGSVGTTVFAGNQQSEVAATLQTTCDDYSRADGFNVIIDRAAFNQGENAQYEPRIEAGETMSSLVAKGPHAVAQPIAFNERQQAQTITENCANTLSATDYKGVQCVAQPISIDAECNARTNQFGTLVRGGEGGTQQFVAQPIPVLAGEHPQKGVSIDVCPTLPAAMGMGGGHTPLVPHPVAQPIAIAENTIGRQPMNGGNGDGFTEDGPMYTLNATGVHGVAQPIAFKIRGGCEGGGKGYLGQEEQAFTISATQDQQIAQPLYYESHPKDSRVKGPKDVADTVSASYGTGGGNTPLVQQPFRKVRRAQSDSDFETWEKDETANTINCFDVGDVRSTNVVAQPIGINGNIAGTIDANYFKGCGSANFGERDVVAQPIAVDWRTAQVDQGITQTLKTDLAKMSGPCVAVDVYNQSINGQTSATITEAVGGTNTSGPKVMHSMDFRKSFYEIKKDVLVRKYPVDTDSLKRCLKKHKKISNNKISELLNLPKTKIEHWFRQDDSFAIPSADHWFQLKEILHIETNIFDQSITEFIIEENKYDSTNRIYDSTFPSPTLTASNSGSDNYITHMAIRRLTPKECERLQGFPDDWTKIPYRNKTADQCPDGPRYKACGNSMAVPVMRWIGQRIQYVENLMKEL